MTRLEKFKLRLAFRLMPVGFKLELSRALELAWSGAVRKRGERDTWPDKQQILRMIRYADGRPDE